MSSSRGHCAASRQVALRSVESRQYARAGKHGPGKSFKRQRLGTPFIKANAASNLVIESWYHNPFLAALPSPTSVVPERSQLKKEALSSPVQHPVGLVQRRHALSLLICREGELAE